MTQTADRIATAWNTQPLVQTALQARRHLKWSVVPMFTDEHNNKKPCVSWKPLQVQAADEQTIQAWQNEHHPKLWGVITGGVSETITLDFDGEDGRALVEKCGFQPHRRTGSGGFQQDFKHPGWYVKTVNHKSSADRPWAKKYPGLDVRGDGGIAVIAGSNRKGQYTWLRDPGPDELSLIPEDMRKMLGLFEPPKATGPGRRLLDEALLMAPADGRNNAGFWLACRLRDRHISRNSAESVMREYQSRVQSTNTKEEEEEYTLDEALSSLDSAFSDDQQDSQALRLVKMALEHCELFSTPKGEFYGRVDMHDRIENLLIGERGGAFKRWLMNLYLEETGTIANPTALSSAISVLEAKAQWGGAAQKEVYVRIAYYNGNLYLDLADKEHNVVEISSAGWKIIRDSPVYFRRPDGMLPLPMPVSGGTLDELRTFVNAADEDDWLLIKAWLHGAMHPTGPYPILDLNGERGSAKTSAAKRLRMVIDPHQAPLRKEPKDDQTFAIMAHNSYVVALDNLSHLSSHLSDLMCTLSTGAGDAYRKHYSNDEEVIFNARRPQVFTGIEELATRGDLIDRCIIIKLPTIAEENRRDEHTLDKEFEEAHPRILGALLDAVSLALCNLPNVHLEKLPRMADFALWVHAAERKLAKEPGSFLAAYKRNREEGVATEIGASPVGQALLKFMEDTTTYESSMADLLTKLKACVEEETTKQRGWPKNARALSGALKRLAPSLRATGLHITQGRNEKGAFATIRRVTNPDANSSNPDANKAENDANFDDLMQKNNSLRHTQTEDTRVFTPILTQTDANNGFFSTWPPEKKEETDKNKNDRGVDRNNGDKLRQFASASPTEELAKRKEVVRQYGFRHNWPKLTLYVDGTTIKAGQTNWDMFLRRSDYHLQHQLAYEQISRYNAMYPQRGNK